MQATEALDGTLRKYILGRLTEPDRLEVEERLVTQPETYDALTLMEQGLIEEYLDGTLPRRERASFERQVTMVTGLRQKVRFARTLRDHAAHVQAEARADRQQTHDTAPTMLARLLERLSGWATPRWAFQPAWALAAAAVLVALAGGNLWFATGTARLQGQVDQLRAQHEQDQARVEQLGSGIRDLQSRLDVEQRARVPREGVRLEGAAGKDARAAATPVPTFVLATGLLRSEGALTRVAIPASAQVVRFRLTLTGPPHAEYRALLQDANGDELVTVSKLRPFSKPPALTMVVPAAVLPRGDYQVRVTAIGNGQAPEPAGTYGFRVTTR